MRFLRSTALWILLAPYAIGFLGAASNQLVLNANGDCFPVRVNPVKLHEHAADTAVEVNGVIFMDDTHIVMTRQTHLNWLADIFDFKDSIESIGDLLIELGGWLNTFCPFVFVAIVCGKLRQP